MNAITMTYPQYKRGECRRHGRPIHLTYCEKNVLLLLMLRTGSVVPLEEIIIWLWDNPDFEPDSAVNNVRHLIRCLRLKLGADVIRTRFCFGYELVQK